MILSPPDVRMKLLILVLAIPVIAAAINFVLSMGASHWEDTYRD